MTDPKRMTEESIRHDVSRVQTMTDSDEGATMAIVRIERELDRARASEAEKDKAIAALADALTFAEKRHAPGCPRGFCTCGADAALRLAGRLP